MSIFMIIGRLYLLIYFYLNFNLTKLKMMGVNLKLNDTKFTTITIIVRTIMIYFYH